ncbi:cysteine-rich CWC family protein [Alkalihalobacillus sp. MEB130]|uniref:cysteine-rich CWC family protein n=1 Tax=Alkalihalobacillus sp. MEB130 TaxID=2976704 RepID=UPI0028DEBB4A|nr:cysteine-rich CWC family protein [Alkalihalobacillus sp. MEB130]MDT8861223.1 cysteine-rich CWC family protein [Alkalihalobacillus sp. MEB130]
MNNEFICSKKCPICKSDNQCGLESCWCTNEYFPHEVFELIPNEFKGRSCICKPCLESFKK